MNFTEAAFFEEMAEEWEIAIARPTGVPLPKWEEIFEKRCVEGTKKKKQRGGKRKRRNVNVDKEEKEVVQNTGVSSYTRDDGKTVYYLWCEAGLGKH